MSLPTIGLVGASTIVPLTHDVFVELLGDKKFLQCSLVRYSKPGQLVGAAADGYAIDIPDIRNVPGKYALSLFYHHDLLTMIETSVNAELGLLTENGLLRAFASYKDDSNNPVNHAFPIMAFMPEESATTRFQPPAQDPEFLEAVLQSGKTRKRGHDSYTYDVVCEICPGLVYGQYYGVIQLCVDWARFRILGDLSDAIAIKDATCGAYEVAKIMFHGTMFLEKLPEIVGVTYDESLAHSVPAITRPDLIDPKNW